MEQFYLYHGINLRTCYEDFDRHHMGVVTESQVRIQSTNEPRCEKTGLRGFLTRSDTNQAVQSQKMARGLKFRI